jgi:hypothetical protein
MAIPKKGSRSIVVDGVTYRWRVRKDPTYEECYTVWNGGQGSMTIAVENAETVGSVLLIYLGQPHPGIGKFVTAVPITPSQGAQYIKESLAQGWKATENGSAFEYVPEN